MTKKNNKIETVWWTGLTAEDMKSISKKKSRKKTSESWSNEYSDVDRSPKKPKKSKRK
jgi:hypothetical protein